MPDDDRLSDERVQEAWGYLARRVDEYQAAGQTEHLWPVAAGSPLAGDNRTSTPWQVSHAAGMALNGAVDHLHALCTLIGKAQLLHAQATWTLARGAIENAATALWLVGPGRRPERISRTLRWHAQDARDGTEAVLDAGLPMPRPLRERMTDFRATAIRAGIDPEVAVSRYSSTGVVRYADEHRPEGQLGVLFCWRLCSAFAHGRAWSSLGVLELDRRATYMTDVRMVRMTNTLDRMLYAAWCALDVLDDAVNTYQQRAAAPY